MISWSKVASQTTASSRNYAWVVAPGSCSSKSNRLTRQTETCRRTSRESAISRSLYREMIYPMNVASRMYNVHMFNLSFLDEIIKYVIIIKFTICDSEKNAKNNDALKTLEFRMLDQKLCSYCKLV